VYISHRLEELIEIGDYIAVLRDGCITGDRSMEHVDVKWIIEKMVGGATRDFSRSRGHAAGAPVLQVRDMCLRGEARGYLVDHVSFDLRAGEILGIYGLMGAGRTELFEEFSGASLLFLVVDLVEAVGELLRGEDVLGDREIAEQVQFLEHHADAVAHCIPRRRERDLVAVEQYAAGGRLFDAGDDLHQRRLSGSVLADQHVDGAFAHLEIGVLDRNGAGIDFRDVLELEDDVVAG
jgi:ABC-type uncharacterized transport system ATPase subunit